MSDPARRNATLVEFLSIPEHERFHELVGGAIIEKASPSGEHGGTQTGIVRTVAPPFQRRSGGRGGPGGWWIATEVEVMLASGEIVRPDVVGWRRERCPEQPRGKIIKLRPDWVCEVLSPSNANHDTVKKLRSYHRDGVPHYWIADPLEGTLTVMRWSADGYVTILSAERDEVVRAEPFEELELTVATLLGDDPA